MSERIRGAIRRRVAGTRRVFAAAVLAVALPLAAATGCAPDSGEDTVAAAGGPQTATALTVAISGDEGTLTPYTYSSGYPGYNLMSLVFDTLLVLDPDNQLRPLLATAYTASDDSTVFTLPLREGVTWHDGKPFTADDVLFSVDYYRQYDSTRFAGPLASVTSVKALGDGVVFTLRRPDPEFPVRLLADMPVLPKHIWSTITDPERAPQSAAVGTGPYKLTGYQPDSRYELAANAVYPIGMPRVQKLTVSVIPDQEAALAALRSGDVHMVADEVPPNLKRQLTSESGYAVTAGSSFSSTLLIFNDGKAPFDRVEVRRAISAAIDTEALRQTVMLGQATAGSPGFWHPDALDADRTLKHRHDPAAATAALDALGATPGADGVRVLGGQPLAFDLLVYASSPDLVRAAELISEMLTRVGITATVRKTDPDTVDAKVWPDFDVANGRDFDLAMWGWSPSTMTDLTKLASLVAVDPTVGQHNVTGIADAELDAAARALLATTTVQARRDAALRMQKLYADKVPFVTLYYPDGAYAYRGDIFAGWAYQRGWGPLNKHSFVATGN